MIYRAMRVCVYVNTTDDVQGRVCVYVCVFEAGDTVMDTVRRRLSSGRLLT